MFSNLAILHYLSERIGRKCPKKLVQFFLKMGIMFESDVEEFPYSRANRLRTTASCVTCGYFPNSDILRIFSHQSLNEHELKPKCDGRQCRMVIV